MSILPKLSDVMGLELEQYYDGLQSDSRPSPVEPVLADMISSAPIQDFLTSHRFVTDPQCSFWELRDDFLPTFRELDVTDYAENLATLCLRGIYGNQPPSIKQFKGQISAMNAKLALFEEWQSKNQL
ncbi:MAG: hypothetical protein M3Q79_00115 [bacterium]|nr:hypothetical protein [bacterium]